MLKKLGLVALAVAVIAGLGLWAALSPGTSNQSLLPGMAAAEDTAAAVDGTATKADLPAVPEMVIGNPEAKVTIIEYASYTCPHCAHFHDTVFKALKRDYIDTDKVQFILRDYYRNRVDLWAGMMARCGGAFRFFGMADMLFSKQDEWFASDDPAVIVENLKRLGRSAGMEDAAMDVCMQDKTMAEALIAKSTETSTADQVQGTPTVFINGVRQTDVELAPIKAEIDRILTE